MKKTLAILPVLLLFSLYESPANAEPPKPSVTVLHAGTKSASGKKLSYPIDGPAKMILAQAMIFAHAMI